MNMYDKMHFTRYFFLTVCEICRVLEMCWGYRWVWSKFICSMCLIPVWSPWCLSPVVLRASASCLFNVYGRAIKNNESIMLFLDKEKSTDAINHCTWSSSWLQLGPPTVITNFPCLKHSESFCTAVWIKVLYKCSQFTIICSYFSAFRSLDLCIYDSAFGKQWNGIFCK